MTELSIRRCWPFAPWDVYAIYSGVDWRGEYGGEKRLAGGFWTRRGAQRWIDNEKGGR